MQLIRNTDYKCGPSFLQSIIHLMSKGFQGFDKVSAALKDNDLYDNTELDEHIGINQTFKNNEWIPKVTHKVSGVGSTSKQEVYSKINEQFSSDANLKDFSFSFKLKVGDKLPTYSKLIKVADEQEVQLIHKQGEVLLIDVWATWCGPCQKPMDHNQKMLETNEAWKDKVRIVAVSVDEDINSIRTRIDKKKWNSIQHLTLLGWNGEHNLIKNFAISGIPFVALINKAGVIDYVGHASGINLEEQINNLVNSQVQSNNKAEKQEKQKQKLQEQKNPQRGKRLINFDEYKTIIANIQKLEKQAFNLQGLTVMQKSNKKLKKGREGVIYQELNIYWKASKQQSQIRKRVLQILNENLPQTAICDHSYVDDLDCDLQISRQCFSKLADQYKIPHPQLEQRKSMNVFDSGFWWNTQKSLRFSPVVIGKDISVKDFIKLKKTIYDYVKDLPEQRDTTMIQTICQKNVPISLIGNPFFGVENLNNSKTNQVGTFYGQIGRIDLIAFYWSAQASEKFIRKLVNAAKSLGENVHVNVISKKEVFAQLLKLKDQNQEWITLYEGGPDVQEIELLDIRSTSHLTILNKDGIVIFNGPTKADNLGNALKNADSQVEQVDIITEFDPLDSIMHVLNLGEVNVAIAKVPEFDYKPRFDISYCHNIDTNRFSKPKVTFAYRSTDEYLFEKIVQGFKKFADVKVTRIEIFQIPKGKACVGCNSEVKLPYYFYYFTNTFRCMECAEKINENSDNLFDKYLVKENGLLVLKQHTSVDKERFGSNIQAKNNEEAQIPTFMCNGCGVANDKDSRYICFGCNREPRCQGDYVDFCFKCAKALAGTDEESKNKILKATAKDGHKDGHSMYRINFSPQGYYDF